MIGAFQAGVMASKRLWTPQDIVTQAWYDAADTITIAHTNDTVSAWYDKSGNNRNLTSIVNTTKTNTRTLNSKNVLDFQTANISLAQNYAESNNSGHVFMVFASDQTSFSNNGGARLFNISLSSTNNRLYAGFGINIFQNDKIGIRLGDVTGDDIVHSQNITTNPYILYGGRNFQTGGVLYINGTLVGTDNTLSNTNGHTVRSIQIGGDSNGYLDGYVAEFLFTLTINATTRQKLEGYLAHKWGLTANLPSDHPYKAQPPRA